MNRSEKCRKIGNNDFFEIGIFAVVVVVAFVVEQNYKNDFDRFLIHSTNTKTKTVILRLYLTNFNRPQF